MMPAAQKGLTLLETLLVLVLFGILIGFAMPNFSIWMDPPLQREAKRIGKLIGDLREEALMTSTRYRIVFDSQLQQMLIEVQAKDGSERYLPHPRFTQPLQLGNGVRFRYFSNQPLTQSSFGFQPLRFEKIFGEKFYLLIDQQGMVDLCQIELAQENEWIEIKVKDLLGRVELSAITEGP